MRAHFQNNKNVCFAFLILVFLFYGNTLRNKYALDDDYVTVTNLPEKGTEFVPNHKLVSKGFSGIAKIWKRRYAHDSEGSFDYRPFTTTTFAIEYAIFGQSPFASHLINLLLYFVTVWFLFCTLLKLFEDYEFKFNVAFLSALFFLIHPIHSEVVNNLKCRDELLAFSFSLLALSYSLDAAKKMTLKSVLCVILFLLLGLFSKKTTVLFIAVIPLCLLFFRKVNLKYMALTAASFLIVGLTVALVKRNIIQEELVRHFYHFENPLYTDKVSLIHRLIIGVKTFGFYVKFLIFPFPFRSYYGAGAFDLSSSLNTYFFIGISFLFSSVYFIYKKKSKLVFFASLLFCGSIFPFLNIGTPAPGVLAERFAFFASFGFCLMIAILLNNYFKNLTFTAISHFFSKPLIYMTSLMFICMIYIWNRNVNWYDKLALFEHDIKYLEKSAKANSLLANEYFAMLRSTSNKYPEQVLVQKALKYYNQAIVSDSVFFTAYNNAGVLHYSYLKDIETARMYFTLAIKHKPLYAQAYENLGNCYRQEKDIEKAISSYRKAIQINPNKYAAYLAIIGVFFEKKEFNETLKIIEIANNKFPQDYELKAQEANCYFLLGDTSNAINKYEEAYKINPNQNLAQFLAKKYEEFGNNVKSDYYKNIN
jgi:tetratricopeptide (TPR) repeat protein/type IV secretory pathway VirB2 component (pilin)